jgi:hypothetical protein
MKVLRLWWYNGSRELFVEWFPQLVQPWMPACLITHGDNIDGIYSFAQDSPQMGFILRSDLMHAL